MPSRRKGPRAVVYWDACCFVSLINEHAERMEMLGRLYKSALQGAVLLVTSTLSIVEVNHATTEQLGHPPDESALKKIDALWQNSEVVRLVEFHRETAFQSRNLIRELRDKGIRPPANPDCIHLASARMIDVAAIHTYDDEWWPLSTHFGIDIKKPDTLQIRL